MFAVDYGSILLLVIGHFALQTQGAPPPFLKPKIIPAENENANRPDHLNGLPLERDGELNRDFRKELLLGTAEKSQGKMNDKKARSQIEEMFKKADQDHDGRLSKEELKAQIVVNVRLHLAKAKNNSGVLFEHVDLNGDGLVEWPEYKTYVLVERKVVDAEHAKKHAEDHEENLDANSRFMIDEEKAAFQKADADGNGLDEIEWLGFQHPEHSRVMLNEMTDEIINTFDRDQDGQLTAEEFTYLPAGVVADKRMDQEYVEARHHEFESAIDANRDGKATKEELRDYLNPLNENHAEEEVDEIMDFADENKDSFLSLNELLAHADLLLSSSFLHPRTRLHDDL